MGLTHVAVKLLNSDSQDTYEAEFLVDTGAMDTMAPAFELKKIGMQPVGKDVYEMANGEIVEYEYGIAKLTFMGEVTRVRSNQKQGSSPGSATQVPAVSERIAETVCGKLGQLLPQRSNVLLIGVEEACPTHRDLNAALLRHFDRVLPN